MREFISIRDFLAWFFESCDEPVAILRLEQEFEGCIWMPLDYLTDMLSPTLMENLTSTVDVIEEIQIKC